jgi:indole-3-acetate monooxygenase
MPLFVLFSGGVASVMLGIATRAMEELAVLAQTKKPVQSSKTLAQSTLAQVDIARAEAGVGSARSFLHDAVRGAWDAVQRGDRVDLETRLQARLAATHAGEQACAAVDLCYKAAGGSAVYAISPLQRCFRDVHTASAHVMVGSRVYETVGRHRFGLQIDTSSL